MPIQIQSYARGLLVRAVDPYTRGALRERMKLVGSAVHLRSFLDPAKVPGHTIKGSGLVSFRANRFNTTIQPMDYHLERAINKHIQSLGVQSSDYNFGPIKVLAPTVGISINGRRYKNLNMHIKYHRIFCFVTKNNYKYFFMCTLNPNVFCLFAKYPSDFYSLYVKNHYTL